MRVQFQEKPFDVFIGRPSKWSNPFPIRKDRTREQAVTLFEKWIRNKPELLKDLHELRGRVLGCWCKENELCHGDVLIKLVEEEMKSITEYEIALVREIGVETEKLGDFMKRVSNNNPVRLSFERIKALVAKIDESFEGRTADANVVSAD